MPKRRSPDKPAPRRMGRPSGDFSAHAQILAGAAGAFGRKGYADCSVEDILEASGVSRRTFYRFFRNKEEVFDALFEISAKALVEAVDAAVARADGTLAKFEAGIEAFFQVQAGAGPLARVLLAEPMRPGSKVAARRSAIFDELTRLFQRESARLDRHIVDPLVYRGLLAALEAVAVALQAEGAAFDIERGKKVMMRILVATLALPGEAVPPLPSTARR